MTVVAVVIPVMVAVVMAPRPILLLLVGRQLAEIAVAVPVSLIGPAMVINRLVVVPRVVVGVIRIVNAVGMMLRASDSCERGS
jgi:hypothetical protein